MILNNLTLAMPRTMITLTTLVNSFWQMHNNHSL